MIFRSKKHNIDLYNTLLLLSRNIFFYNKIKLPDSFETRIYLMFMHFSILMIISKKKGKKFDQKLYDFFFHNIENNLRENGLGDVAVNSKMKNLNKSLYDILLKIEKENKIKFKMSEKLISRYFADLDDPNTIRYKEFESYFSNFYHFCFELPLEIMVRETINFKN